MKEMVFRFLVGGVVVLAFSALGDVLQPKSFAVLFGAAPSVTLATLALTIVKDGVQCIAVDARRCRGSLGVYSHLVMGFMAHRKRSAILVSVGLLSVWFAVAVM